MHRPTRRIAIVLALLAAVALLGPTAATQFLPMLPADDIGNQVHLQPSSGPTGSYAYLEDGEIVIDVSSSNPAGDIDGVDADSVTRIEDVFVVHYAGSEYADVWLTHEGGDDLTFLSSDRPVESPENAITLGPNETASVGLLVDATDGNAIESVDEFTVHARAGEPESESASVQDDDDTDGWSSGAASSPTEPADDGDNDGDETSVSPSTTTVDSSAAESTVAPADDPETTEADATADETTMEKTTQRTTAPNDDSTTGTLFGDRAGLGPRSALGMALVALLAALAVAVVLGGRRG